MQAPPIGIMIATNHMNLLTHPSLHHADALAQGVAFLSAADPDFACVHAQLGPPPLWAREPGFPTLVRIILEQQVSLASAQAAFNKLAEATQTVTPQTFLTFNDEELKKIGFSRQKTRYCRELSLAILNGELDLDGLGALDDDSARSALVRMKGIGPWTADIYLLMALLRPDIWPVGDLALATAVQKLKRLAIRPGTVELEMIAQPWRPWRAVAARLLWHFYLSGNKSLTAATCTSTQMRCEEEKRG